MAERGTMGAKRSNGAGYNGVYRDPLSHKAIMSATHNHNVSAPQERANVTGAGGSRHGTSRLGRLFREDDRRMTLGGLLIGAGALALAACFGHLRASAPPVLIAESDPATAASLALSDFPAPAFAAHAHYETVAIAALEREPMLTGLSRDASYRILANEPNNVAAWNRLVYIDLTENGRLTRDGLAALYRSYAVSPFGDPRTMSWRVDLASETWSSLPEDLRASTLAQIPVLGHIPRTWDWRIETCRNEPVEAIALAVCDTAPGSRNRYHMAQ